MWVWPRHLSPSSLGTRQPPRAAPPLAAQLSRPGAHVRPIKCMQIPRAAVAAMSRGTKLCVEQPPRGSAQSGQGRVKEPKGCKGPSPPWAQWHLVSLRGPSRRLGPWVPPTQLVFPSHPVPLCRGERAAARCAPTGGPRRAGGLLDSSPHQVTTSTAGGRMLEGLLQHDST